MSAICRRLAAVMWRRIAGGMSSPSPDLRPDINLRLCWFNLARKTTATASAALSPSAEHQARIWHHCGPRGFAWAFTRYSVARMEGNSGGTTGVRLVFGASRLGSEFSTQYKMCEFI